MLIYLKRSSGELASYQQKMFRIDDHVGIAIAGLTSDARVLRWILFLYRTFVSTDIFEATLCDNKPCLQKWFLIALHQLID